MNRKLFYTFIVKPLVVLVLYAIIALVVVLGGLNWEGVAISLIIILVIEWDFPNIE